MNNLVPSDTGTVSIYLFFSIEGNLVKKIKKHYHIPHLRDELRRMRSYVIYLSP